MLSVAGCTQVQVSQKFSTRVNRFVHSSRPLYRPIKRHNWSVPVQPLAQKNWGTQKPQKTGRRPDITNRDLTKTLRDQTVVGTFDIRIVGSVWPFNCEDDASLLVKRLGSRKSAARCLHKGVNGLKLMVFRCISATWQRIYDTSRG